MSLFTHGGRGHLEYDRFFKPYLDRTNHSAYDFPLFMTIRSAFLSTVVSHHSIILNIESKLLILEDRLVLPSLTTLFLTKDFVT